MLKEKISTLIDDFKCNSLTLNELKSKILGKSGLITLEIQKLLNQPKKNIEELRSINQLKSWCEKQLFDLQNNHTSDVKVAFDPTLRTYPAKGSTHILYREMCVLHNIMKNFGFVHETGPIVENEYYNFDSLNIDKDHPARDSHDTFFLHDGRLLRTHTSCVQIHVLEKHKYSIPFSVYSIGSAYRRDDDTTHSPHFHQIEGFCINSDVTLAYLKTFLTQFLKIYFEKENLQPRFRLSYFPFTCPSLEVDIAARDLYSNAPDKWLEVFGAGMISQNILQNYGYPTQGFAFGGGVERLVMLKHQIYNLHAFYKNEYAWLQNYA